MVRPQGARARAGRAAHGDRHQRGGGPPAGGQLRAAVLNGPSRVDLEARDDPRPGPGEALVRLVASGVCGTDVEIVEGRIAAPAGVVLGHEGAGTIEAVDEDRTGLAQGTPVVVDPAIACGACAVCREGRPNLCPQGGLLGRDLDGLFAEQVAVAAANCHVLPDGIDLLDAPALQVLATVVHAHERVHVVPGRVAAVIGLGFTGQLHAQLLAHRGARVLGIEPFPDKRELARSLGCDWVAAPEEADAAAAAAGPVDLVVECSGSMAGLAQAIRLARPGGTLLSFGIATARQGELPFYEIYFKELTIVGTRALAPRDLGIAIDLAASGAIRIRPLVSDRLPLAEAAEAVERSAHGALKVMLEHR